MSINGQDYRSNVYWWTCAAERLYQRAGRQRRDDAWHGIDPRVPRRDQRLQRDAAATSVDRSTCSPSRAPTPSAAALRIPPQRRARRCQLLRHRRSAGVRTQPVRVSLGGPIKKDRLFYFIGYEGLREHLGKTIISFVPDDNARRGILPDGQVTISPIVQPYLDAIPAATGPSIGDGLAPHSFAFDQTLDQNFFQGRLDYQAGAGHRFFARYSVDDAVERLPTDYPQFPRSFISTNQFVTAEYQNVFSNNTLQSMRFGYSRTRIGQNVEANLASPLPPFAAGRGIVGDIDIGGMQRFGPQTSANLRLAQNVYSGQQTSRTRAGGTC
jgi:hypothetical protein